MNNSTPGPWRTAINERGNMIQIWANREYICTVSTQCSIPPDEQVARMKDNAELIASAPDLLIFTKAVLAVFDKLCIEGGLCKAADAQVPVLTLLTKLPVGVLRRLRNEI